MQIMNIKDKENTKDFLFAGNAFFTLDVRQRDPTCSSEHYTFRVHIPGNAKEHTRKDTFYVRILTGPDNTSYADYSPFGMIFTDKMEFKLAPFLNKESLTEKKLRAMFAVNTLLDLLSGRKAQNELNNMINIYHLGRCGRCNRNLSVPSSILSGIGPECAKKS